MSQVSVKKTFDDTRCKCIVGMGDQFSCSQKSAISCDIQDLSRVAHAALTLSLSLSHIAFG